jgi:hypothetical protein
MAYRLKIFLKFDRSQGALSERSVIARYLKEDPDFMGPWQVQLGIYSF